MMVQVSFGRLLVVVAVAMTLLACGHGADDDCGGSLPLLIAMCKEYVEIPGPKKDPSPLCCSAVEKADVPCVCRHVNSEIEKVVSMEKAVYVADKCGKPLPHGYKCGSYTVP